MKKILITAAGGILSRSLAKCLRCVDEELTIIGIDADPTYIPLSPLDGAFVVPPFTEENAYLEAIESLDAKTPFDFIFPQTDVEIRIFAENRDRFPGKLWLPPSDTIAVCQDKVLTNRQLSEAGVPVPRSLLLSGEKELKELKDLFAQSGSLWIRNIMGSGGKGAKLCKDVDEAREWVEEHDGWGDFMASEYLPGRIFGWDSLWKDGELVFSQTKERLRYGPGASPTVNAKSTSVIKSVANEQAEETSKRAVLAVDEKPDGIFAVDLREDAHGISMVTEINAGRFLTTSTILFEKTGVLLPYYAMRLFLENVQPEIEPINPIEPNLYLVGSHLTDAKIFTEEELTVPSWKDA